MGSFRSVVTLYGAAAITAAVRPVTGLLRGRMPEWIRSQAPAMEAYASATRSAPAEAGLRSVLTHAPYVRTSLPHSTLRCNT